MNHYRVGEPCVYTFREAIVYPGRSTLAVRILISVIPRMYREAIALSIHQHQPDLVVRLGPPEDLFWELGRFKPHLLVSNDGDGLSPEALDEVPCWVEVLYTDHMSARIRMDGRVEEVEDMDLQRLLAVVDETRETVTGEAASGEVPSP
jgi:hypothetical protein